MKLSAEFLDNDAAVINFDDYGGYVMVEEVKDSTTDILLTVFDSNGDVLFENVFAIGVPSPFDSVRCA
jgi:hypothetical protein